MLRFAPDAITKPIKEEIAHSARAVSLSVKRRVKHRTGNYRRLIRVKLSSDKLSARVGLIGKRANRKAFYARILESDRFRGGRFQALAPALERHRGPIARRVNRRVDEALDRLAQ